MKIIQSLTLSISGAKTGTISSKFPPKDDFTRLPQTLVTANLASFIYGINLLALQMYSLGFAVRPKMVSYIWQSFLQKWYTLLVAYVCFPLGIY